MNIAQCKGTDTVRNLKPEQCDSPLVQQEKYREKTEEKSHDEVK